MRFYIFRFCLLFCLTPAVSAADLIWKDTVKPLTVKASYTKFNDFFLYDDQDKSESLATLSVASELAQEGDGWGYELSLYGYHSLSDIKGTSTSSIKDKGLSINFKPVFHLTEKQRLFFNLAMERVSQLPGDGLDRLYNLDEQIDKETQLAELSWQYGGESSPRYFDLKAGFFKEGYNNQIPQALQAEYSSYYIGSELGFLYTSASHLLINLLYRVDEYELDQGRDADYFNGQIGVSWKPSQATHLRVLLGYYLRQFEQRTLEDSKGLSWSLSAEWSPVDRFKLALSSMRNSVVTQDINSIDSVLTSNLLRMEYALAEHVRLMLGVEYKQEEFNNGRNIVLREIDDRVLNAQLSYEFKKSWLLAIEYFNKDKKDTSELASYDQNIWTVSVSKEY